MSRYRISLSTGLLGAIGLLSACGAVPGTPASVAGTDVAAASPTALLSSSQTRAPHAALPKVVVHKSRTCGCCGAWVDHMREAGFPVEVRDEDDLMPVKRRLGIAPEMMSCHTAEVDGYIVEGHVPAGDIQRMLAEKPAIRGLILPGMPIGSPGMEAPDGTVQPYVVSALDAQGRLSDYSHHGH